MHHHPPERPGCCVYRTPGCTHSAQHSPTDPSPAPPGAHARRRCPSFIYILPHTSTHIRLPPSCATPIPRERQRAHTQRARMLSSRALQPRALSGASTQRSAAVRWAAAPSPSAFAAGRRGVAPAGRRGRAVASSGANGLTDQAQAKVEVLMNRFKMADVDGCVQPLPQVHARTHAQHGGQAAAQPCLQLADTGLHCAISGTAPSIARSCGTCWSRWRTARCAGSRASSLGRGRVASQAPHTPSSWSSVVPGGSPFEHRRIRRST